VGTGPQGAIGVLDLGEARERAVVKREVLGLPVDIKVAHQFVRVAVNLLDGETRKS
jgi:hypothetical protein